MSEEIDFPVKDECLSLFKLKVKNILLLACACLSFLWFSDTVCEANVTWWVMLASYQARLASELDGYLHQGSGANTISNEIITSDLFNKGKITLLDKGSCLWLLYLLRFHLYPRKNQFHVCQCYKEARKIHPPGQ